MNFTTLRKSFQRFNNSTPAEAQALKKFSAFSYTPTSFNSESIGDTENVYTFAVVYGNDSFQILISGAYLPNSTWLFFRKIKVSRGAYWLGGRKSPRDILHILIVKPIHYENILFRLSADYKVRNAKTCSSENADALSTKQVRYDSHKYDIGSVIEMYEYRTIR